VAGYFLKGFLVFVPVAATIGIVKWAIEFIDGLMPFDIAGLGLIVLLLLIMLTGFLASNYIGKRFFELVDKLFNKVPVVKLLYSALKDMIQAFVTTATFMPFGDLRTISYTNLQYCE